MAWTCPDCGRSFGAEGRQHMCEPGLTLDEFFADAHPDAKPIFEAIAPRLSRKVTEYQGRYHHVVNMTGPADVDEQLLDWLTEAFYRGEPPSSGDDGMVPDDIDEDFLGDAL